jgi:nucleoside-diphosphate-sugar epimerase
VKRIVVTGGSGKLGRAVVRELADHDYEVVTIDRTPPHPDAGHVWFTEADLTDFGQVLEALGSVDGRYDHVDGVAHLAAIPAPGRATNSGTFHNNVPTTWNVFEAARQLSITEVVWASSETVLGLPFETHPPYIPLDEEYAVRPESTYSLGKAVEEEMARHFTRWNPAAKYVGLRFSNVMDEADYARFASWQDDASARAWNLWSYIDARDGAQAVRLALESPLRGFEAFIIAAEDSVMRTPSAELASAHFGDVPLTRPLEGTETLMSIDKAKRMLGYAPTHTWRNE